MAESGRRIAEAKRLSDEYYARIEAEGACPHWSLTRASFSA